MELNIPNLLKLKAFFDAGAPHYAINMDLPLGDIDNENVIQSFRNHNLPLPSNCGSAGCIAGAAYQFFNPDWNLDSSTLSWRVVRDGAVNALGFPILNERKYFYGHDLFNPSMAPKNVTAAQCAVAIQNVIDGKAPWN